MSVRASGDLRSPPADRSIALRGSARDHWYLFNVPGRISAGFFYAERAK
jgi:hypothetical protein